ncbi:MAG: lipase chaperone LimK [Paraglaciecola sp.]|jgi:lipase chaperone LimK
MKWLVLGSIFSVVLIVWQIQPLDKNLLVSNSLTDSELIEPLLKIDIDGGSQVRSQLSATDDWLDTDIRFLFDFFAAMFVEDERVMWDQFNQFCAPLAYCLSMTDLYKRYLDYKVSLGGIAETPLLKPQDFTKRLDDIEALRRIIFSKIEKRALFADTEIWDRHAIDRMQINQDPGLRDEEKMLLLEQHIESLPAAMKASIHPTLNLRKIAQMREQSETWGEGNYNSFSAEFGPEVAQRLVNVENDQQQWRENIRLFQSEKEKLVVRFARDSEGYQLALQDLETQMFDPNESRRLKVYLSNPSLLTPLKNK